MRRKRIAKEEKVKIEKDEIESQWSLKRIAIFVSLLAIVLFFIVYFFQARAGQVLGEKEVRNKTDEPQIELPDKDDIEDIISNAEDSISNINPNDIISSQPQIQQAIENLQKLTGKDNVKKSFCSAVCGE